MSGGLSIRFIGGRLGLLVYDLSDCGIFIKNDKDNKSEYI